MGNQNVSIFNIYHFPQIWDFVDRDHTYIHTHIHTYLTQLTQNTEK